MKTIQVSDEVHKILTNMGSKNQSYNDIIYSLIEKNRVMEEFNEEEVEYYNKCIENLEKGDYSNTYKIKLEDHGSSLSKSNIPDTIINSTTPALVIADESIP